MNSAVSRTAVVFLALVILSCAVDLGRSGDQRDGAPALNIQYLEIVTPDADATCELLAQTHGVTFGDPVPELGNARTAALADGRVFGVRKPLRPNEEPVVRPYLLVDDIQAAVQAAEDAGAEIAIPPLEIPGWGTFAIYLLGGIDHGLWEL